MKNEKTYFDLLADSMRSGIVNMFTPSIEKVIFKDPLTIVIWSDGLKTIVRCQGGDVYDKRTGLLLCCAKRLFGNTGRFNDELAANLGEFHDAGLAGNGDSWDLIEDDVDLRLRDYERIYDLPRPDDGGEDDLIRKVMRHLIGRAKALATGSTK